VKLECGRAVIKKCLLNTVSDLVGKGNRRARKQRLIIKKKFKAVLQKYLHENSFYSLDEHF